MPEFEVAVCFADGRTTETIIMPGIPRKGEHIFIDQTVNYVFGSKYERTQYEVTQVEWFATIGYTDSANVYVTVREV